MGITMMVIIADVRDGYNHDGDHCGCRDDTLSVAVAFLEVCF